MYIRVYMYTKYKYINDIHVNIFIYEYMCLYAYICMYISTPLYKFIHVEPDLIINKLRSIRLANQIILTDQIDFHNVVTDL